MDPLSYFHSFLSKANKIPDGGSHHFKTTKLREEQDRVSRKKTALLFQLPNGKFWAIRSLVIDKTHYNKVIKQHSSFNFLIKASIVQSVL